MKKTIPLLSLIFFIILLCLWANISKRQSFSPDFFPYFEDFCRESLKEIQSGRLRTDFIASFFRWASGFFLAALIGVPTGLFLGKNKSIQNFLLPFLNIFRSLSPLAWIPFAVLWFGIGDPPVIFLIFLGCVFPLLFTTTNAVMNVPKIYDQLARDYHYKGSEYFFEILFPSVLPQIISSLRLVASIGWVVLVPAEMLAGKEGLGFAILDARNGMRTDLLVFNMLTVALVAHSVDFLLKALNQHSQVRWGHEQ